MIARVSRNIMFNTLWGWVRRFDGVFSWRLLRFDKLRPFERRLPPKTVRRVILNNYIRFRDTKWTARTTYTAPS